MLNNLAIAGYRSFGPEVQYFERLSKINLLIGTNNSGKSNVLKFLEVVFNTNRKKFDNFDYFLGIPRNLICGVGQFCYPEEENGIVNYKLSDEGPIFSKYSTGLNHWHINSIGVIFSTKAQIDNPMENTGATDVADYKIAWSFWTITESQTLPIYEDWKPAFKSLNLNEIRGLRSSLHNRHDTNEVNDQIISEIISDLHIRLPQENVYIIPAIREISISNNSENTLSGLGLIEQLSKLQNPTAHQQSDKKKFAGVRDFLRAVTNSPDAEIEIPHDRATIIVHMNGRSLPLEFLGSGIHEVIILAAASTVVENAIVCMEEPEIHLNPILQRKLIQYLREHTSNQYFIATHSHVFMDTPDVEIYSVRLIDGKSVLKRVTSSQERREVCEDLGYHPSDLLQSNCVIWVEGPTDRIYIKYWLNESASELVEGIHYSIMFYGGRLASHLSHSEIEASEGQLISLRRLNSRSCIVLDSDKANKKSEVNDTKRRLVTEFAAGPGHAWITEGREIENYLDPVQLKASAEKFLPDGATLVNDNMTPYVNCLKIKRKKGGVAQLDKVEIARDYVGAMKDKEWVPRLDLKAQLDKLVGFIRSSNPSSLNSPPELSLPKPGPN